MICEKYHSHLHQQLKVFLILKLNFLIPDSPAPGDRVVFAGI